MEKDNKLICVGVITSAHGIKGAVKIRSFTEDPAALAGYSPLYNSDASRKFVIKTLSENGEMLIAQITGISNRNDAEMLGGTELFVYRDMLPEVAEDEFYYEDLIGLHVKSSINNNDLGVVTSVYNHGAGDIIEIRLEASGKSELLAFTKENVPEINISGGYIVISLPDIEFIGDNDN